jgi:hypothetical protein
MGSPSGYNAGSCGGNTTWSCAGTGGGSTASCSIANAACPVNGSCGGAAWTCNAGSAVGGSCGGSAYNWSCQGANGGTTASCSLGSVSSWTATCAQGGLGDWGGQINGHNDSCSGVSTWDSASGCCLIGGNSSTTYYPNGVAVAGCNITINGSCGGAAWTCNAGSAADGIDYGCGSQKQWQCNGSNGGTNTLCTFNNDACAVQLCWIGNSTGYNYTVGTPWGTQCYHAENGQSYAIGQSTWYAAFQESITCRTGDICNQAAAVPDDTDNPTACCADSGDGGV